MGLPPTLPAARIHFDANRTVDACRPCARHYVRGTPVHVPRSEASGAGRQGRLRTQIPTLACRACLALADLQIAGAFKSESLRLQI